MPITMTIITNGLLSAEPKPLGNCNIIVANIFPADFLPFPLYFQLAGDRTAYRGFFPLPPILRALFWCCRADGPRTYRTRNSLAYYPSCVRPAISLRPDPPRSARASQMRISLGFQTR